MTPKAQRMAIAEECGWRELVISELTRSPTGFHPTTPKGREVAPDYLNDLNAMHEAEKVLTDGQFFFYATNLWYTTGQKRRREISATAAQRCEAFLRTLNLWDDSK